MNKRNSKETLLTEIHRLTNKLNNVYEAGSDGIGYVGMANYASREHEAQRKLDVAMYGDE